MHGLVVADLMAVPTAIGLDEIEPLLRRLEILRDAVTLVAGAREAALVRDLDHRSPVDRRVILRRGGEVRRGFGDQVQDLARLGRDFRRVDETVAAHPNLGVRFGQVRHDVTPAFVGDRDLGETRAELGGLRYDPHPGFRPEPAGDHTADIVIVDGNRRGCALLSACPNRKHRQGQYCRENGFPGAHGVSPSLIDFKGIRRIVDQVCSEHDIDMLPTPKFHHLHLNSTDPDAAIDFYTRQFPSTEKQKWGGFPALKSPNEVMVLFTQVDTPSVSEPQSAIWHFGWHVTDSRRTLETFKTRRNVELLPLYTSDEGGAVLISSDTWPGQGGVLGLTKAQIAEAR